MDKDLKDFLAKVAGLATVVFGIKVATNFVKELLAIVWFVIFCCAMGFILLVINFMF